MFKKIYLYRFHFHKIDYTIRNIFIQFYCRWRFNVNRFRFVLFRFVPHIILANSRMAEYIKVKVPGKPSLSFLLRNNKLFLETLKSQFPQEICLKKNGRAVDMHDTCFLPPPGGRGGDEYDANVMSIDDGGEHSNRTGSVSLRSA